MQTVEGLPAISTSPPGDSKPPEKKPTKASDVIEGPSTSRFSLRLGANWWRSLQCIGISLHFWAPPRPPNPNFVRHIPSTISNKKGTIALHFYLPRGYDPTSDKTWPAVINFHGGGFTIGNATDDARFARFVLEKSNAVFVSVDYRLAPEHPFPTAVEDGADALLYLIHKAKEFRIDANKLATSGFSAGANICITAPLRLAAHIQQQENVPGHSIVAVASWYPALDYTLTRAERRASAVRPDQLLPPNLTSLFDASYLFPTNLDISNPFLSPAKASDELLRESMPPNVILYACEWDMLRQEAEDFANRLQSTPMSKKVQYHLIKGVPHGWDKGPNPLRPAYDSERLYEECCNQLKAIFEEGT